jgi:hypothetical protein
MNVGRDVVNSPDLIPDPLVGLSFMKSIKLKE